MSRRLLQLTPRDRDALTFIGRGYEVAQYQLHGAIFAGRAATVVSRFVHRWSKHRMIVAERLNRTGFNRLRLTAAGRDYLVASGVRASELFVPRRPTALKDLSHLLWINDLRVAAARLSPPPDTILPAWMLQRRFGTAAPVIPDLLCVWLPRPTAVGGALACEIDLGGESIRGVLQPKINRLQEQLANWAHGSPSTAVVFTTNQKRSTAIGNVRPEGEPQIVVASLPDQQGEARFEMIRDLLQRYVNSYSRSHL
jgi:hypothetical protein